MKVLFATTAHLQACLAKLLPLMLLGILLTISVPAIAQVTVSLSYQEKNGLTTIQSGQTYTMQLNYSVSSTTGNATGVQAVIDLPDNIYGLKDFVGTSHAPIANFVFSNVVGAKKLTITFIDPTPSGSTGVLEFGIISNNLTTLNNTILATTATLTATGGYTSGAKNHNMTVTAIPHLCVEKTLLGGGAIDNVTTYRIVFRTGGYIREAPLGTLQATNMTLTDNLPTGATFVSATIHDLNGVNIGTGAESGGVVTAAIPDISLFIYGYNGTWEALSYYVDIKVRYNTPTFNAGDVVTNTATVNYTPYGGSPATLTNGQMIGACTSDLVETTTLALPVITGNLTNTGCVDVYPGNRFIAQWQFANTGNVPLDNVEIISNIPANARLDQTAEGRGARFDVQSYLDHVEYQTNLTGATWVSYPKGTYIIPLLPTGEYFTKLKFVLISPFAPNTTIPDYNFLSFVPAYEPLTPESVEHCMVWNSTTTGIPTLAARTNCNNCNTLQPRPTTSKLRYAVGNTPSCQANLVIGQNLTFTGTATADEGFSDAQNPIVGMFIPHGYQFVSESFGVGTSGIATAPTLQIVPNFITNGGVLKDLYRWTFPTGTILPYGKTFTVSAEVKVTAALSASGTYITDFMATAANTSVHQPENIYTANITDTGDWDLDGNTTEQYKTTTNDYCCYACHVAPTTSMESIKWVKGLCDNAYSRYPAFGQTVPGGNADYLLVVKNTGNIPMKEIKIVDILPFVGDRGIIDPSARNTEWRPNLATPIVAPSGTTVYYTTVSNPCRDEVKQPSDPSPFPTGCVVPNWSVTPPTDITKVQAIKIDFGTTVLNGADSLVFNWAMRAPVNAPTNNEIAWNSYAFVATRTDNNQPLLAAEPIKVGIKVKAGLPAFYGNRVWFDADRDGIQDANEGGVDGIVVKLFSPVTSGVQNPATDLLVNFTVTGNGGSYIFSNLNPGDYYAVFCLPNDYTVSPKNAGGTAETDSDGTPITYNSGSATMTAITNLVATEIDLTWDQGIYCNFIPTVSPIQRVALGAAATLTATGGATYSWTGPNGFNATTASVTINNVTASDTGTYTVNVYDGNCYASLITKIEISTCTPPSVTSVAADTATCTNGVIASNAKVTVRGIGGGAKYSYGTNGTTGLFAANATTLVADSIQLTGIANPSVSTTYTFRIYASDTLCYNDTTVVLTPSVCPPCSLIGTFTQNSCNNNGTTSTSADDYFTITVSAVSSTNGGTSGKYEVILNGTTVLNAGGTAYGTSVTVGGAGVFSSNGATTYNLKIRDLNVSGCETTVFTTSTSAACSTIPCPIAICLPVTVTRN